MAVIVDVDVRVERPGLGRPELESFLARVCSEALREEGWDDTEVSVVITGDEEIRALNRDFRDLDEPTDVLSFPLVHWDGGPAGAAEGRPGDPVENWDDPSTGPLLGDVVISIERACAQAEEYGHSLWREIGFLAVHGVLHLLGYDHQTDSERKRMRQREEAILGSLGLSI